MISVPLACELQNISGVSRFPVARCRWFWQVWSVDVAPLHGSMGVLIRPGSDFIAANLMENRPMLGRAYWFVRVL